MKQYHLTIISKTKLQLDNFLNFLGNPKVNSYIIKKKFKNKKTKKKFTVLKSPHVYKTAQEQFQSSFFSQKITLYSNDNFPFSIFLKRIKNNLFSDLKFKIEFQINKNLFNKTEKLILNPNNFRLNMFNKLLNQHYRSEIEISDKQNYEQMANLLKIFDFYSELLQK